MLLFILVLLLELFLILVQLTIQCNNSYHTEKLQAMKIFIMVGIAHLLVFFNFSAPVQSNVAER